MIVRVRLFALARQLADADLIDVAVPEPGTVVTLRKAIEQQFPQLAGVLRHAMIAIDTEYAGDSAIIPANAEVACIPPVSGG